MGNIKLIAICMILFLWCIRIESMYGQNDDSIKEYRIERIAKRNNWYSYTQAGMIRFSR